MPGPLLAKNLRWAALPGTVREIDRIVTFAPAEPPQARRLATVKLTGANAEVPQIVKALPKARYAHLATHGFFADKKFRSFLQVDEKLFDRRLFETGFFGERRGVGARNPLRLTGLVFAGANNPKTPRHGILTGDGILSMDLRPLDLAVLSACDTGLADVAGGQGVYSLQWAFHVAGCKNVIASLWRVEDEATAALMGLFYRNLWQKKMEPLDALRHAQLYLYYHPDQIAKLAKARGPDFTAVDLSKAISTTRRATTGKWAAFVLSGIGGDPTKFSEIHTFAFKDDNTVDGTEPQAVQESDNTGKPALFAQTVLWIAGPIVIIALVVVAVMFWRRKRQL